MSIEGYSSEVVVYDSGGVKNYLRLHYVATESGSGYNVVAQLQVKHTPIQSASSDQTVAAGTSSVSIDGDSSTITWTRSNTITIRATTTAYQTLAEHAAFVEARVPKTIEIAVANANLANEYGSAINYNGGASVAIALPKVIMPTNKSYGSSNNQSVQVVELYGSANALSTRIARVYGSVGGEAKLIYQGFGHLN